MNYMIAAVDNNWGIGYKGQLLESIPEDLKRFKILTSGYPVIMGRKTWDSLPKKPLPGRLNIVITKDPQHYESTHEVNFINMGFALNFIEHKDIDKFIIGGSEIYKTFLPYCDRIYLTKIFKEYEKVDSYFPNLDNEYEWFLTKTEPKNNYTKITHIDKDKINTEEIEYQFQTYDRFS